MFGVEGTVDQLAVGGVPSTAREIVPVASWVGYWPVMHALFHVASLDLAMWLRILGASLALMLLVEIEKAIGRRIKGSVG